MSNVTNLLKNEMKALFSSFTIIKEESKDIGKVYWATDVNTIIAAKGASDPVTVETDLTKTEYSNGITTMEQLDKFFSNQALTTSDYLSHCQNIKYGDADLATALSSGVEALGDRMYQVSIDCIELFKQCRNILNIYTSNEVSDMVSSLENERIVPGTQISKADFAAGITLVEQFKKLLNNETTVQGSYETTLANWELL